MRKKKLPPPLACIVAVIDGILIWFTVATIAVSLGCTLIWLIGKL